MARSFHDDLETRAVVLTGRADAFSAGIDLKERSTRDDDASSDLELREVYYRGVKLCQAWEDMPQIAVAAIEGMAVGAGVALPLALDWRVMSRDAFAASCVDGRSGAGQAHLHSVRAHGCADGP